MKMHPLYDEFDKEGYYFLRLRINPQTTFPKVVNNNNLDDWCLINTTAVVNGQVQITPGPECSQKTIEMMQRFWNVLVSNNGEFMDYTSLGGAENENIKENSI